MGCSHKKVHVYVNDRVNRIIQDVWDGPTLTDLLLRWFMTYSDILASIGRMDKIFEEIVGPNL